MAALDEAGIDHTVRRYPEAATVARLPRTQESRAAWLQALVDHPRLVQRPLITAGDGTTVVARDPEALARIGPPG